MDDASVPPAAQRGGAAASTAAAAAAVVAPPANDDPVLAMLYRMEQKIESPPTTQTAPTTARTTVDDREAPPPNHAVHAGNDGDSNNGGVDAEASMPLPSFPAAAPSVGGAGAEAAAAGRGRKRRPHEQQQQQHPPPHDDKPSFQNPPKATRINWSKSPHRERLSRILDEWFAPSGRALDESTGRPVANYKVYAAKVGISPTTLWKYICTDPTKRRSIKDGGDEGSRGKKRLIDGAGIKNMVDELRGRMGDGSNGGFARQEAVRLVMERFGLTQAAASRQLTRHILPALAEDEAGRASTAGDGGRDRDFEEATQQQQQQQQRHMGRRRSIVIAGAASRMGRALFGHCHKLGHDVVGCVAAADERVSLTTEKISQAQLTVVDIADDDAVRRWAHALEEAGMEPDLIVVVAETCPESKQDVPAWEVPREDFDRTLHHNVSAVATVVRHFVPLLIRCHCHADEGGGADDARGAFVALSSSLGRSPHPRRAAYSASKFAIEGLMKSVAASLPGPLCAVPLAPGAEAEPWQQEDDNKHNGSGEWSNAEMDRWAHDAGRLMLGLTRKDNGRSLSVKGRYSTKERQRWIIQDGTGVPGG